MTKHKIILACFVVVSILISIQCSNPFKSEEKKELVNYFFNDILELTGRYVLYWDGKDNNNNYITPGRYIIVLIIKDWQDQLYVTAEPGGKVGANDKSHFEPGYWQFNELEPTDPDSSFQIQAGVNIRFLLAEPAHVRINIYKD
ncbi:hypothetical protein JXA70_08710 [candidate division KSB1 bacterium]|nr:hypothetical protein [candidate division KSB1 bacterium]